MAKGLSYYGDVKEDANNFLIKMISIFFFKLRINDESGYFIEEKTNVTKVMINV